MTRSPAAPLITLHLAHPRLAQPLCRLAPPGPQPALPGFSLKREERRPTEEAQGHEGKCGCGAGQGGRVKGKGPAHQLCGHGRGCLLCPYIQGSGDLEYMSMALGVQEEQEGTGRVSRVAWQRHQSCQQLLSLCFCLSPSLKVAPCPFSPSQRKEGKDHCHLSLWPQQVQHLERNERVMASYTHLVLSWPQYPCLSLSHVYIILFSNFPNLQSELAGPAQQAVDKLSLGSQLAHFGGVAGP